MEEYITIEVERDMYSKYTMVKLLLELLNNDIKSIVVAEDNNKLILKISRSVLRDIIEEPIK